MENPVYSASENKTAFAADGTEVLFFNIDNSVYGVEIEFVNEIIGIEQITVVPKIPDYIKGVINIRGKVVPVISIRKRFGMEEIPYDDRTCIIVLEFENGTQVGVIVDRVQEVVMVEKSSISKVPDSKNVNANRYIKNIIKNWHNVLPLIFLIKSDILM